MAPALPRTHRRLLRLFIGACLFGAAGCHQPVVTKPPTLEQIPASSFQVKQYALLPMEHDKPTDCFVRDNLVIVYTENHTAFVLDRDSLANKWVAQVSGPGTSVRPPVVLKDYVVFPTISALEVYDRFGKNHRSLPTRGLALRSGAIGDGARVFFGGDAPGGGRVENIDLSGSQYQASSVRWELATRGGISVTPAIQKGLLYIGDDVGSVYAVNADTRAGVWALKEEGREPGVFHAGGPIRSDIKADETGVYVGSMDTKLYCLNLTDGRILWRYFAGQPLVHTPDLTTTSVYLYVEGTGLVAIDKGKGESVRPSRWAVKDAVGFLAEDEKLVYLQTRDHSILAVDLKTGEPKFKSKRHDYTAFAVNPKGNTIFCTTADGTLRAAAPVFTAGGVGELASLEMEPVMASTH